MGKVKTYSIGSYEIAGSGFDGWISPDGLFHWCGFGGHGRWMEEQNKNEDECVKRGWKRFESSQHGSLKNGFAVIHGGPKEINHRQSVILLDWAKKFDKRIKVMDWAGSLKFEWFV